MSIGALGSPRALCQDWGCHPSTSAAWPRRHLRSRGNTRPRPCDAVVQAPRPGGGNRRPCPSSMRSSRVGRRCSPNTPPLQATSRLSRACYCQRSRLRTAKCPTSMTSGWTDERDCSANRCADSCVLHRHVFHYVVEDSITYLCMADEDFKRRIPFAFLEDIKVGDALAATILLLLMSSCCAESIQVHLW